MTRIRLSDHVTSFTEWGDPSASPVILVHSALLDRDVWAESARLLHGVRAIAYDLRGHGSATNAPPVEGIDQLARDLADLLDRLRIDTAHVVGVSLGGAVAQQFAADRTERIRTLTLVATAVRFPRRALLARARSLAGDRQAVLDSTLQRWFSLANLAANVDVVRYARSLLSDVRSQQWERLWTALAGYDAGPSAARIGVPVLALAGEHDTSTPPTVVAELASTYHQSQFKEIHGAAHLLPLESPTEVARVLLQFLHEYEADVNPP